MPKAPAFPDDEKTTIESGWEEEASTTIEQGELAEKLRATGLEPPRRNGVGNITSTGNSVVDEPTVDDQRAHAAIAMIAPPSLAAARIIVTQGNDAGQHLEVVPDKTYTIGRAIDNDFVLTDIAVSRKHFDLRQDNGAWIVVDRGSGNGTLVNGNLEDQPFVLANGDLIEIGNTTFRFEQANAPPRAQRPVPVAGRYDVEVDEEEPSTVAGKPVRGSHEEMATPSQMPPPQARPRPKTVPPPAPVPRARNAGPSPGYPVGSRPGAPAVAGLPGLPPQARPYELPRPQPQTQPPQPRPHERPQPQTQPPQSQPQPQMQPPRSQPQPQMHPSQLAMMGSTMGAPQAPLQPGTTLPMPQMQMQPRPSPMGPALADSMPPRPGVLPPTTIPGQGPPSPPSHPHLPYSYPSISDIHKHAQLLVVGNGTPRDATSTALVQPTPFGVMPSAVAPTYAPPAISRKTKLLLAGAGLTLVAAFATIAIMKGAESKGVEEQTGSGSDSGSDSGSAAPDAPSQPLTQIELTGTEPAKIEPAKTEPEPAKIEPAKTEPEPAKTEPEPAKTEPAKTEPEPAKTEPAKTEPEPAKTEPEPTKPEPPKKPTPRVTPPRTPPRTTPPRRTATATRPDTSAVRNRAIELYRQKKFKEASTVLNQAAASISGREASDLRTTGSVYAQLGVAYNRGMSPGASPLEAYNELRKALNLDSSAPGAFTPEIRTRLAQVAPKAAIMLVGRKDYTEAFSAVRIAEANGISNADTKVVRGKLEQVAKEIYEAAAREIDTSPDTAKAKLKQIKGMVDGKSPTLAKANALLKAS